MPANGELARRVVEAGRRCSLTTAVLREWAGAGSPKQVEYLAAYLEAEAASRDSSKRASLLRRCGLPAPKTFDGYDWSAVSWPEGLGREGLLNHVLDDGLVEDGKHLLGRDLRTREKTGTQTGGGDNGLHCCCTPYSRL